MTYPLRVFAPQIKAAGLDIRLRSPWQPDPANCDVLVVSTEVFGRRLGQLNPKSRNRFLENMRRRAKNILWLDMVDGTGTTSFGVLPYVNLYAKSHLLVERQRYTQPLYSGRIYSQFYHEQLAIVDGNDRPWGPLPADQMHKLALAWNFGLGDWHTYDAWQRRLRVLFPARRYAYHFTPPDGARPLAAAYRASDHSSLATVAHQRRELRRRLAALAESAAQPLHYAGKIPYRQYVAEMARAAVAPSPFGYGEICPRDFDAFIGGAALLKPDVSHMQTWPDYYLPGQTYQPFAWDFSDFESQLSRLWQNPDQRLQIARAGQERFRHYLSPAGGQDFAGFLTELFAQSVQTNV